MIGRLPGIPELSPRLRGTAGLVPACDRLVDVGCDHAWLAIHLVLEGRCPVAVASDLREAPAARARHNIVRAGLEGRIQVEVAPGLAGVCLQPGDSVVIGGLGAVEIAEILRAALVGLPSFPSVAAVVLQPQKSAPLLRNSLYRMGFHFVDEALAEERGRVHPILSVLPGEPVPEPDPLDCLLGPILRRKRPALFGRYALREMTLLARRIHGMESASSSGAGRRPGELDPAEGRRLLRLAKELLEEEGRA